MMMKQVEIANLKIWLWLAQLVEGTFGGDRISFFSKKNQNWIGGEQIWILKRPVKVKLGLARQIFNGRCTFSVFFYKEATENRFLDKFNKLKSGREQNGSKKCARHLKFRLILKTLPEAQRTQGIDSFTWVISPARNLATRWRHLH